eukprot:6181327-Pleurochrysis_carterae.AAC.2
MPAKQLHAPDQKQTGTTGNPAPNTFERATTSGRNVPRSPRAPLTSPADSMRRGLSTIKKRFLTP